MVRAQPSALADDATKRCWRCGEDKSVHEFGKGRNQCKDCRKSLHQDRINQRAGDEWACKLCQIDKPASDFHPGVRICRDCTNQNRRNRRVADHDWAEKERKRSRQYYANHTESARQYGIERWGRTPRPCKRCGKEKLPKEFVRNRQTCLNCNDAPVQTCTSCWQGKRAEDFQTMKFSFTCRACRNKQAQRQRAANPERVKKNKRTYLAKPESRQKINWQKKLRYHNDSQEREKIWERNFLRIFGMTIEERELKKIEQGGRCAICGWEGELDLDHNHVTNEVRQFLCPACNKGLGKFGEGVGLLLNAIEYLRKPALAPHSLVSILDKGLAARFEIPHWEAKSRNKRFRASKNQNLKRQFKITIDQYEALLDAGNGVCWICRHPETTKKPRSEYVDSLHVDHCHVTGVIRGLLCGKCNTGVGSFKHDIEILQAAIKYLEHWNSPAVDAA